MKLQIFFTFILKNSLKAWLLCRRDICPAATQKYLTGYMSEAIDAIIAKLPHGTNYNVEDVQQEDEVRSLLRIHQLQNGDRLARLY